VTPTSITIGSNGEFRFSAAHSGIHRGEMERLYGHTYLGELTLTGDVDAAGMICDFADIEEALARVIAPLKKRTIMPERVPGGSVTVEGFQVLIRCGYKFYSLPADDVVLLPVDNTTTEALAGWILGQLFKDGTFWPSRIHTAELVLHESPSASGKALITRSGRR
jgi:6-pyruvoyl-tetrahydropterin synthase